jgi:hypothetical protein
MTIYSGSHTRVTAIDLPRVALDKRDSLVSYPTIQRTSGDDRLGETSGYDDINTIMFSDNSLVKHPVLLPISGNKYIASVTNSLLTTEGVVRKGVSDSLLLDLSGSDLINSRQNKPFEPFVEIGGQHSPRILDEYWSTGSIVFDVGEGFKQPVYDKTFITIDITPNVVSSFGQEDYANVTANPPFAVDKTHPEMYPMAYYNFQERKWDKLGTGSFGGNNNSVVEQDAVDAATRWMQNTPIGFSNGFTVTVDDFEVGYAACRPIANFGFPLHEKFHATGSQLLDMSNYLNNPFLLEKFIVELTCDFTSSRRTDQLILGDNYVVEIERVEIDGSTFVGHTANTIGINTLFLLNQRTLYSGSNQWTSTSDPINLYSDLTVTSSIPNIIALSKAGTQVPVRTTRDLICYAQLVSYSGSLTEDEYYRYIPLGGTINTILDRGLRRELALDVSRNWFAESSAGSGSNGPTSFTKRRIVLSGSCRDIPKAQNVSAFSVMDHTSGLQYYATHNIPGGYNNVEGISPTGRHINSTVTTTLRSSGVHNVPGVNISLTTAMSGVYDRSAPYLLLPSDKLILGWQVPLPTDIHRYVSGTLGKTHSVIKIYPESAKLTLIGSLIREQKEFHDVRNDPLNTNAAHEALHYDNPVLDQFDVAQKHELSGTYIDDYITGSLLSVSNNIITPIFNGRGRIFNSSDVSTQVGRLGTPYTALYFKPKKELAQTRKFIKLENKIDRVYDSYTPDVLKMIKLNGGNIGISSSNVAFIVCNGGGSGLSQADNVLLQTFPFEPRYNSLTRIDSANGYEGSDGINSTFFKQFIFNVMIRSRNAYYTSVRFLGAYTDDNYDGNYEPISVDEVNKYVFGIGDGLHKISDFISDLYGPYYAWYKLGSGPNGCPVFPTPRVVSKAINYQILAMSDPLVRGWRYGLESAFPVYSSVIYRRDKYGQFRDMLEQSLDTKFVTKRSRTRITSPVTVKFVNQTTKTYTTPENTWSSNLSNEMTSSLPFFDNESRNRPEINVNALNNTIVMLTQDNNGNLMI